MSLQAVILGSAGTYPTAQRNTTAIYCKSQYASFLLDAGEGFQSRLLKYNLDFSLDFIIISHFHIDHFTGLIPYLSTMNAMNRTTPIKIYTPNCEYLLNILKSIKKDFCAKLSYTIEWVTIVPNIQYIHNNLSIEFFKVEHTIQTYGVLIESLNNTSYNKQKLANWGTNSEIRTLFDKGKFEKEGVTYTVEQFISCTKPVFRIIYSGDTTINSPIWDKLTDETLIFHECTHYYHTDYLESSKKGHTHFKDLIDKKIKNPIILLHLGAKITPLMTKRIKKPDNYFFAQDNLQITQNIKKDMLSLVWPGIKK